MLNYYRQNEKRLYSKMCEIVADNTNTFLSNKLGRSVTTEVEYDTDYSAYVNGLIDGTPFKIYHANYMSDFEELLYDAPEKDYQSDDEFLKDFKEYHYMAEKEVFVSLMCRESILAIVRYQRCNSSLINEIIGAFDYSRYIDEVEQSFDDYDVGEFRDHCINFLVEAFD